MDNVVVASIALMRLVSRHIITKIFCFASCKLCCSVIARLLLDMGLTQLNREEGELGGAQPAQTPPSPLELRNL